MQPIKIIILALLFQAPFITAMAQGEEKKLDQLFAETTAQQRAQLQTEMMQAKLNLNEEQKTKVQEINLEYAQKLEDTYKAPTSKVKRLRRMKSVSDEKDAKLKSIFTESQYDLYQKHKQEMKDKMMEKRKEG